MGRLVRLALAAAVCLALGFGIASGREPRGEAADSLIPVWIEATGRAALQARVVIERAGGRVVVYAPEAGGTLAWIPDGMEKDLLRLPASLRVSRIDRPSARPELPDPETLGRSEALTAPEWWNEEGPRFPALSTKVDGGRPFGADWRNTSEYLAGRVSVNLILVESSGEVDDDLETWTAEQENEITTRAAEALEDVVEMHPGAGLGFTLHVLSGRTDTRLHTRYEPISRPADPYGEAGVELWMNEVLANLGYGDGSRLYRSRQFADATRIADGSDWAVNVFVVNSAADEDGRFADGRFAWSWIGGPHAVMTYDNSGWGIDRFHHVLRHELHHAFFALDQYAASNCACTAQAGYLAGMNGNCELDCDPVEPDVMINNVQAVSDATRIQVGTYDGDRDGTPDILQIPPEIEVDVDPERPPCSGLVSLVGTARVVPPVNDNPWLVTPRRNISLRRIVDVEISVDGGTWDRGMVYADDGQFDEAVEGYSFTLSLPLGRHWVQVRAIDDLGQRSSEATISVDAAEEAAPLGASLRLLRGEVGLELDWNNAPGAATYHIRQASRPDWVDDSDPVAHVATTSWRDGVPGTVFYRVTAVDVCGREATP